MNFNSSLRLLVAVVSLIIISSCGSWTTTVTEQEAYDAGYTIGKMLSGK